MRILITDGDNRSALAATRSLGARGHEIIVGGERAPCLSSVSRYCARFEPYPAPAKDPDGFVASVAATAARHKVDAILPMTEITTLLLTERRAELPPHAQLPFATSAAIASASDKSAVMKLALSVGVPIPATVFLDRPGDVDAHKQRLSYPAVIKPARSRVRTPQGFVSTGVSYAVDADDLAARVRAIPEALFPVLLQERIEGPGVGLFACYDEGRPVALFAHERLREKPPSGGVSVLRQSAPLDSAAVEYADKLLRALRWHGVAMVEFKRDLRDNSLRLMEINGRFWGSLQLAIDAGVDFPAILLELAAGRHPEPVKDYRLGVRTRWFWGDMDALLTVMFRSRAHLNLPRSHPGRLRVLWQFMHLWGRDLHYEVLRLDDLRPWLLETRRWFTQRG